MIDAMTRDQLRVATDGIAGPYLMVPLAQLAPIRAVLDRHAVALATRASFRPSSTRPANEPVTELCGCPTRSVSWPIGSSVVWTN
jgi:hypothetical protein